MDPVQRSRTAPAVSITAPIGPAGPTTKRSPRYVVIKSSTIWSAFPVEYRAIPRAAARIEQAVQNVERLIAVKRRDLDRDHGFNQRKLAPENTRQHASSHRGLQIKTDHRQDCAHVARPRQKLVGPIRPAWNQQRRMISKLGHQLRFLHIERTRDLNHVASARRIGRQPQNWLVQSFFSNRKLRRMNPDRDPSRAGVDVILSQADHAVSHRAPERW